VIGEGPCQYKAVTVPAHVRFSSSTALGSTQKHPQALEEQQGMGGAGLWWCTLLAFCLTLNCFHHVSWLEGIVCMVLPDVTYHL
jgi:hypothetical protein